MRNFIKIMSTLLTVALVSATLFFTAGAAEKGKDADVVATVNDATIGRAEFDRSVSTARKQFAAIGHQQDGSGESSELDLQNEVLDRLIDIELMIQDSRDRNINVADIHLTNYFEGFREQFEEDSQYTAFLEKNSISEEELKDEFMRQLTLRALQNRVLKELRADIKVAEEDVRKFYDQNLDQFKQPEQAKASHILITVEADADEVTKKAARKSIEEIDAKLKGGADFSEVARESSQCPSSSQGGELGYFSRGMMVKPFEDAVFSLKPGEVSGIVETQFGYHLIRLDEIKPPETSAFEDVKQNIEEYLTQSRLEDAQQSYLQSLRDKAKIEKKL